MYSLSSTYGIIAQLGEHLPYKQRVIGSSPIGPIHGEIAQLARAHGSYPWCREFESPFRYDKPEDRKIFGLFCCEKSRQGVFIAFDGRICYDKANGLV